MRRAAGAGDDAPEPAARRLLRVAEEQVGGSVRGHDAALEWHAELLQPASGVLHRLPIGVAAHNDAHDGLGHDLLGALVRWKERRARDRRQGAPGQRSRVSRWPAVYVGGALG